MNLRPIKAVVPITPTRLLPPFTPNSLLVDNTSTPVIPVVVSRRASSRGLNVRGIRRAKVTYVVPAVIITAPPFVQDPVRIHRVVRLKKVERVAPQPIPDPINPIPATYRRQVRARPALRILRRANVTVVPDQQAPPPTTFLRRQVRPRPQLRVGRRTSTLVLPLNLNLAPATFTFIPQQLQFYLTTEPVVPEVFKRRRPLTLRLHKRFTEILPVPDQASPIPRVYRRQVRPRPAFKMVRRTSTLVQPLNLNLTPATFTFIPQQLTFTYAEWTGARTYRKRVRAATFRRRLPTVEVQLVPTQNSPIPQVYRRQVRPRPALKMVRRTVTTVFAPPSTFNLGTAVFTFVPQQLQFTQTFAFDTFTRQKRRVQTRPKRVTRLTAIVQDQTSPAPQVYRREVRQRPFIRVLRRTRTQVFAPPANLNLSPATFTFVPQVLSFFQVQAFPIPQAYRRQLRSRPLTRILRRTSTLVIMPPQNLVLAPATFTFVPQVLNFQLGIAFNLATRQKRRVQVRPKRVTRLTYTVADQPTPIPQFCRRQVRSRPQLRQPRRTITNVLMPPLTFNLVPATFTFVPQQLTFQLGIAFDFSPRRRRKPVALRARHGSQVTPVPSTTAIPIQVVRHRLFPVRLFKRYRPVTRTVIPPTPFSITPATFTFQAQVLNFQPIRWVPTTHHRKPACPQRRRRSRVINFVPVIPITFPGIIEPTYGVLVSHGRTQGRLVVTCTEGKLVANGKTKASLVHQWTEGDLVSNGRTEGLLPGDY